MKIFHGARMLEFSQKGDERGHMVIVEGGLTSHLRSSEFFTSMAPTMMLSAENTPTEKANLC